MENLDYWRLCDELNIVQAALLVVGADATAAEYMEAQDIQNRPHGYEAAKTAIVHALKQYHACCDNRELGVSDVSLGSEGKLVFRNRQYIEGNFVPMYETDINGNRTYPIQNSIDLLSSTIVVASLKDWLKARGFSEGFFFPPTDTPDFLHPAHPRYAPKLAAAVRAWQAVTDPGKTSPKKALDKWLRENAAQFELTDEEGNPINQAIEDCSKIANWQPGGGAPKTPSQ